MPEHRGRDVGMFDQAELDCPGEACGQETIHRRTGREVRRLVADDAAEVRARRGEICFGREGLRLASRQLRFRLRNVGARHFADVEAITRLLQRLLEHAHVAALDFERSCIAQIVHVDRSALKQHALIQAAQRFAGAGNLALGGARPVAGDVAVIERLRDGHTHAARHARPVDWCVTRPRRTQCILILIAAVRRQRDPGTIARQRLRHVLVGRAHLGALCVELRIVLIGPHQGGLDRVRQGRRRPGKRQQQDRNRSSGEELHPMHPLNSVHSNAPLVPAS
ncbi:hypothetical protein ACVWZR_008808 [Bradyrhizobium sp. i1.3.1]